MQGYVPAQGAMVWLRARRWRVDRVEAARRVVRLEVACPDRRLTVLAPFDTPVSLARRRRPVTVRPPGARARLAQLLAACAPHGAIASAAAAGIDIWPHQFEPVLAMLAGHRRLLIADEVGLGKTIQAGLIIGELLRRCHAARVLVIAPAGLRDQWTAELRARFGIRVMAADEAGLMRALQGMAAGADPWRRAGVWIASADFIKQPHVLEHVPVDPWDLVVIDEAHTAAGASDRHAACDALARRARHVLLLTATPHNGDPEQFQRLIGLGALPSSGDAPVVFRRTRADVTLAHRRIVKWQRARPSPAMARLLDALLQGERVVLAHATQATHDASILFLAVLRRRALSTMAALLASLGRRLEWLDAAATGASPDWQQPSLLFDDEDERDGASLQADVGVPVDVERRWIRRLRRLAESAARDEPKVRRLVRVAARTTEPLVLFTEFRDSLEHVARALQHVRRVSTLHGAQSALERRRQLDHFRSGRTTVLVTTDVGGQGLNLQDRARWVVNLELPWNPTRLEQRVGRVDRIGQTSRVHATMLMTSHAAESPVIESLNRRTFVARRAVGASTLCDMSPPSPVVVAAAAIRGSPPPEPEIGKPDITPCVTFRRRAIAAARDVARRLAWQRAWRGPTTTGTRPPMSRLLLRDAARHGLAVLICAVPFVTASGNVLERRLVAVRVPRALLASLHNATVLAAIDELVQRAAAARLRRLMRQQASAVRRRIACERALAAHLSELLSPDETQLGLFCRRAARMYDDARVAARRADEDANTRAARIMADARITAGRSAIEWIGVPP